MIEMLIRKYKIDDIKFIEELGLLLHDNYKFSVDEFTTYLIIEEDNILLGFISYSIIYERAEINDIVISQDKRNKGYGFKLLEACINNIICNECQNVTLEVNVENKSAIKFYENFGFNIVATRKKYYNELDGYLMKKDLR